MVKVLMINFEYPPLGGGTAVANYYLLREFKRLNVAVDLLTSSAGKFKTEAFSKYINIIRLDIGKNDRNLHHQSYLDLWRFFWQSTLWTLKHGRRYDLIHAFSGLPGGVTAWLSGKTYSISLRGADEPSYEPRHKILWKLIQPLVCKVYRRAASLDTNSQFLKRLVLKSFPDLKIKVIPNGVDTATFHPAKKMVRQPIILCTSRLGERKGVEYLIRALSRLPKAKLLLAGGGQLESNLKQLAKKLRLSQRVKFLGLVSHNHLPSLYRRAKLFVLPSLSESQSNSLLEALASGLPVVATDIGGNPELVNPQNGILVPPTDGNDLAKAITQALTKKWPKISLGERFSWRKTAQVYYSIFCKIT